VITALGEGLFLEIHPVFFRILSQFHTDCTASGDLQAIHPSLQISSSAFAGFDGDTRLIVQRSMVGKAMRLFPGISDRPVMAYR